LSSKGATKKENIKYPKTCALKPELIPPAIIGVTEKNRIITANKTKQYRYRLVCTA